MEEELAFFKMCTPASTLRLEANKVSLPPAPAPSSGFRTVQLRP